MLKGLSKTPIATLDYYDLTPIKQADGTFTLTLPSGEVLSCQPSGYFELRPPGTNGVYERCTISSDGQGDVATYRPGGAYGWSFALPDVPNV